MYRCHDFECRQRQGNERRASAIDAEQRRLPVSRVQLVEFDPQTHAPVAETMAYWLQPGMHHLANNRIAHEIFVTLAQAQVPSMQKAPDLWG